MRSVGATIVKVRRMPPNKSESHPIEKPEDGSRFEDQKSSINDGMEEIRQLFEVQTENLQLRGEVRDLRYEVAELRVWKDKAIEFLTKSSAKRNRIIRAKSELFEMHKKMKEMQEQLLKKESTESQMKNIRQQEEELATREADMQMKVEMSAAQLRKEMHDHAKTLKSLANLENVFTSHIKALYQLEQIAFPQNQSVVDNMSSETIEKQFAQVVQVAEVRTNSPTVPTMAFIGQNIISSLEQNLIGDGPASLKRTSERIAELEEKLKSAEGLIETLEQELKIERGVVAGLEDIQLQKDKLLQTAHEELLAARDSKKNQEMLHSTVTKRFQKYFELVQQDLKKKSFSKAIMPHPNSWKDIAEAVENFKTQKY